MKRALMTFGNPFAGAVQPGLSAPRCRPAEPAAPYLRRCIQGALHHDLRDRVRLVRVSRRRHEQGDCPLGHSSLHAPLPSGECPLDLLPAPEAEDPEPGAADGVALRLTVLEGLSLRAAAAQLGISAMSVSHREVRLAAQRAQKKALAALRLQLAGAG